MSTSWTVVLARVLQFTVAALIILLILALNGGTLKRQIGLFGLRTDVPTIVKVENSCGGSVNPAPFLSANPQPEFILERCESDQSLKISATAPTNAELQLFVNGVVRAVEKSESGVVTFESVKVHRGENSVWVQSASYDVDLLEPHEIGQSRTKIFYRVAEMTPMRVIKFTIQDYVDSYRPSSSSPVGTVSYRGSEYVALSGEPLKNIVGPEETARSVSPTENFTFKWRPEAYADLDGLGYAERPFANGAETNGLAGDLFARKLTLSYRRDQPQGGNLTVTASACVPENSLLWNWANEHDLTAMEFVYRLTGLRTAPYPIHNWQRFDEIDYSASPNGATCRQLSTSYTVKDLSSLSLDPRANFLRRPGDELSLFNAKDWISYSGFPAQVVNSDDGDTIERFEGDPKLKASPLLYFVTTESASDLKTKPNREAEPKSNATAEKRVYSPLAVAWRKAHNSMPRWLQALLDDLAVFAPILTLLFAISRVQRHDIQNVDLIKRLTGLTALIALVVTATIKSLLEFPYFQAVLTYRLWPAVAELNAKRVWIVSDPLLPLAVVSFMICLAILHGPTQGQVKAFSKRGAFAAILSVGALVASMFLFFWQAAPWSPELPTSLVPEPFEDPTNAPLLFGLTYFAAIPITALPIYAILKAVDPSRRAIRVCFIAAFFAVNVPLIGYIGEALRILLALAIQHSQFDSTNLSWITFIAAFLLRFGLTAIYLWALRDIYAVIAPNMTGRMYHRLMSGPSLMLAAAVVAIGSVDISGIRPTISSQEMSQLLAIFRSFAVAVGAFAAISLLVEYDQPFTSKREDNVVSNCSTILAGLFAGYISLWTAEPLAAIVAVIASWFLFRHLLLKPTDQVLLPLAELSATKLIKYRREQILLSQRLAATERSYAAGTLKYPELASQRATLSRLQVQNDEALGPRYEDAKRTILNFGPNQCRMRNGVRGALSGIVFATLLQVINALGGPELSGFIKDWTALAQSTLVDVAFQISPTSSANYSKGSGNAVGYDTLFFICTLLNIYFFWTLMGFIFGYCYDRIKGTDGFVKGVVFACGVASIFLMQQLLSATSTGIDAIRLVSIFIFFVLTGVLVFDAASINRDGEKLVRLADIYGIKTTVGYVSLAGLLASLEPLAGVFKSVIDKASK